MPFDDKESDLEQALVLFMNMYNTRFRDYMTKAVKFNTLTEEQEDEKMILG